MNNSPAIYLGKIVSKENFRVFIYAPDGSQKLVESWGEYQSHMQTGLWFAEKDKIKIDVEVEVDSDIKIDLEKPRRARKAVEKKATSQEFIDDFLPKKSEE